jgi:alpha-galactosidase
VEVHCTGEDQHDHHGAKHTGSNPGTGVPHYISHRSYMTGFGKKLEVEQDAAGLKITSHFQFFEGLPVVRCWTEIINNRTAPAGIEYVSSFSLLGLTKEQSGHWADNLVLHLPRHAWMAEFQWGRHRLSEFGLDNVTSAGFTTQRAAFSSTGSWAAKEMLPMALLENEASGQFLFWQVETVGSWNWEIGDIVKHLYLQVSGPSERENQWWKNLQPGDRFTSVPAAVGVSGAGRDAAFNALNSYRRALRKIHADNGKLPVIFNDYMNCLMADPTTEKLLPLIDKAAAAGAEYFVIDGGWYDDGPWWNGVGEWLPAKRRFPGGIEEPIRYIRKKGMIPGLWLEIERMGTSCRLAKKWPDECFFMRHGKRVVEHHSYQLDFRHPLVVAHADETVRRLVEEYGVGFIKMDYNIEIGPGTEVAADSFGDGLLQHQRAYKEWLLKIYERYPNLIIENCSAGGMRLTYGLMDTHSLCSTTDNQNYLMNVRISINAATGVCPEQAGVWAYPLADAGEEEVIMNMVGALSWRIFLSGQMQTMNGTRLELIKEAVAFYKTFREKIPQAGLVWPMGLVKPDSGWGVFGLSWNDEVLLSVWRFDSVEEHCDLSFERFCGQSMSVECVYPSGKPVSTRWNEEKGVLNVILPERNMARIFRVKQA